MPEPFEVDDGKGRKRNSCKALVIADGKVLLTVNRDQWGDFYLLPGGGQKFGEPLDRALVREVMEETGWLVRPGELVLVRDYIGRNHEFAEWESDVHQTEIVFLAAAVERSQGSMVPDPWQTGVTWMAPEELKEIRLYPSVLKRIIPDLLEGDYAGPLYLGDVN